MQTVLALLIVVCGLVGLYYAYLSYLNTMESPEGAGLSVKISEQIRSGAASFLIKEGEYLAAYVIVVSLILLFVPGLGPLPTLFFIFGSLCSMAASLVGMHTATRANSRCAYAASQGQELNALLVAITGGQVMGFTLASIGLIGLSVALLFFSGTAIEQPLVGFGVGATSVALFARIGGGIYTKAADVGADLVGKVEAGIPEDDPRNPGVIADNVGDNVGDIAGMGADIFESYVNAIVSCTTIGVTLLGSELTKVSTFNLNHDLAASQASIFKYIFSVIPFVLAVLGLISSYLGLRAAKKCTKEPFDPTAILRSAMLYSSLYFLLTSLIFFIIVQSLGVNFSLWFCVLLGTLSGTLIGLLAEYYTAKGPVFEIAKASKTGAATNIIAGISVGFRSVVAAIWIIALTVMFASSIGGVYGIALTAVGMLATTALVMTVDAYGPIADNAGGIAELAGLGSDTRKITDKLDASGNTTAAIGKGFAVCSAALTAISLFGAFTQTVNIFNPNLDWSITNAELIGGALLGASLVALVACLTMSAVGRAAGKMVAEIRRQFKEIPGLLEGKPEAKPDVEKCVAISTEAALSEMMLPGCLAILLPALVGWWIGPVCLGGFILGTTLVGLLLALFMANTGGAWDNAKKFIEQGKIIGEKKGTTAHGAAVVGDTVGDPFKDTTGPSLNILIKLVSMVALLLAPLI
jgi:K(+)-stimulated pyrophosphate-energized sodium pump